MKKGSFALRLFLYASLVSLVWLGGYVVLSDLFAVEEPAPEEPHVNVTPAVSLPATVSTQWSVLAVVDEEYEVTEFWFRYADYLGDTMTFITVPVTTKAELTAGGYEVLKVHNPELPELFMISDLCRIFSEETWCMAAEEVGVALLGVRPKECYVMEKDTFARMTETSGSGVRFMKPVSVKETVTEAVANAVTNDTLKDELLYWESYSDLDSIIYKQLPGEAFAEEYRPDFAGIQQMVERIQTGTIEVSEDER